MGNTEQAFFNGLVIELKTACGFVDREGLDGTVRETFKETLTFEGSQERIVKAGYERHMSFQEQIGLLTLYLENKLEEADPLLVAIDMLRYTNYGGGEWCNQAYEVEQKGKTRILRFYENVVGIGIDSRNIYMKGSLKAEKESVGEFDISDLEPAQFHPYKGIHKAHKDLVRYTHLRDFKDLPKEMKEKAGIFILFSGEISPVIRGYNSNTAYDIAGGCIFSAVSRGVRSAGKLESILS